MSLYGFKNNKIDLWLNAGQSNEVGAAPESEFPAAYTGMQYGNLSQNLSFLDVINLQYASGEWGCRFTENKDLANNKRKSIFHVHSPETGSFLAFQPAAPDWNILSLQSGGSLKPPEQRLIDQSIGRFEQAVTDLAAKGLDYNFKGIRWDQGESDCNDATAANYAQYFKEMRDYYRAHFSLPNLPFIITQTHSGFDPARPFTSLVTQAQFDCSNQSTNPDFHDPYTYITTNSNSYGLNSDFTHYNGAGQQQKGNDRLAIIKNL